MRQNFLIPKTNVYIFLSIPYIRNGLLLTKIDALRKIPFIPLQQARTRQHYYSLNLLHKMSQPTMPLSRKKLKSICKKIKRDCQEHYPVLNFKLIRGQEAPYGLRITSEEYGLSCDIDINMDLTLELVGRILITMSEGCPCCKAEAEGGCDLGHS